jgi:hypothetical protein
METIPTSPTKTVKIGPTAVRDHWERINPTGRKKLAAEWPPGTSSGSSRCAGAGAGGGADADVNAGILAGRRACNHGGRYARAGYGGRSPSIDSSIVKALSRAESLRGKPLVNFFVTGEDEV